MIPDPGGKQEQTDGLRFHYRREERLRKLRLPETDSGPRKGFRLLSGRKGRRAVILLANVVLIYVVVFSFLKPSNVYLTHRMLGNEFEVNVTALRGKKTLVGFTVRNGGPDALVFREPEPVSISIKGGSGVPLTFEKRIEEGTVLQPGESASVVFLFEETELPASALLEVFYGSSPEPLFTRRVRF